MRDNLADTGLEPYPGYYLWASPDIINRIAPSANPAVDFSDMTNDSLWQNVEYGQDNYVYVRIQNRGSADGNATINIYFTGATTFGTPASWIHIGTLTETGIAPGTVRIAGPLIFPQALIPAPGHYCMIAVVTDPLDPAPDHNLITSVPDYLNFVRNTNNIAYRNMDVVDLVPGSPGVVEFEAGAFKGVRERYQLELDLGHAPPGVKVRLIGPRAVLDGAIARGLKLARRRELDNIYDLKAGKHLFADLWRTAPFEPEARFRYGFEGVLLEKPAKMALELLLSKELRESQFKQLFRRQRYMITIRQMIDGTAVGAFSIRLRLAQ